MCIRDRGWRRVKAADALSGKENWVCDDPIRTYVKGTCSVSKLRGKKRSAKRPARRVRIGAPDAWPIASYHVVCSPSRCPSRKSEPGHRKPNSPYPTGHLLLNTPPTPALTADLGLTARGRTSPSQNGAIQVAGLYIIGSLPKPSTVTAPASGSGGVLSVSPAAAA